MKSYFTEQEMKNFEPAEKIGLVACVNPGGLPLISLITSIMAPKPDQLTLGQICKGLSKQYIQQNPQIAFLIMTMEMEDVLIRGSFRGYKRTMGLTLGTVDIVWVYNSMPPAHGQIYPEVELKTISDF